MLVTRSILVSPPTTVSPVHLLKSIRSNASPTGMIPDKHHLPVVRPTLTLGKSGLASLPARASPRLHTLSEAVKAPRTAADCAGGGSSGSRVLVRKTVFRAKLLVKGTRAPDTVDKRPLLGGRTHIMPRSNTQLPTAVDLRANLRARQVLREILRLRAAHAAIARQRPDFPSAQGVIRGNALNRLVETAHSNTAGTLTVGADLPVDMVFLGIIERAHPLFVIVTNGTLSSAGSAIRRIDCLSTITDTHTGILPLLLRRPDLRHVRRSCCSRQQLL